MRHKNSQEQRKSTSNPVDDSGNRIELFTMNSGYLNPVSGKLEIKK